MERIWTTEMRAHAGERVRLAGWLHRLRQLSNVTFLILRDGKGLAQIVVDDAALIDRLAGLHPETVLAIEGQAIVASQAPGGIELHQPEIEILAPTCDVPPF